MARYSRKGQYDTIRKCFTVCKNCKQAGSSAQHRSTVVLPINTVAAAGAWILAVGREDGRGRPARRLSAGGRCSLKSRVIQQGYCEYWTAGGRSFCLSTRPPSQSTRRPAREAGQLLPISVTLPAPVMLHETPFVDVADLIDGDGGIVQVCIVQLN